MWMLGIPCQRDFVRTAVSSLAICMHIYTPGNNSRRFATVGHTNFTVNTVNTNHSRIYSTGQIRHRLTLDDFDDCRDSGRRGVGGRGRLNLAAALLARGLRLEVVIVAPAAAVHELRTLLLMGVVVPLQPVRVARAGLAWLAARVCVNRNALIIAIIICAFVLVHILQNSDVYLHNFYTSASSLAEFISML